MTAAPCRPACNVSTETPGVMLRKSPKLRIGAGSYRYKIEQLQAQLQQKQKQLAKLERIRRVLEQREQVVSRCIAQQVDLLQVLGQLAFSLPGPGEPGWEAQATAAVQALLKDMDAAQLMQAADSIAAVSTDSLPSETTTTQAPQQQQQQQQPRLLLPLERESFTVATLRKFLASQECMATLRRLGSATVEELAGIIQEQTMHLGFAIARYPSSTYLDAAALAAAADEQQRLRMAAGNARLHAALEALGTTTLLLHIVGDKVLKLSMLNLETLEPETPPASFWQELAGRMSIPQQDMAQLHTGFLIYNSKRTQLTAQMQETMTQLQQLLQPLVQEPQQQHEGHAGADSSSNNSSSSTAFRHSSTSEAARCGRHSHPQQTCTADMLQCMEDADRMLQQLSRQVWSLRESSRCLVFQWANVLDPLQLSLSAVHAWPYIVQPPPVLEVLVQQEVARQAREGSAEGDDSAKDDEE